MNYEDLLNEVFEDDVEIFEDDMPGGIKGFCVGNKIFLRKGLDIRTKKCVLAEEIAHLKLTAGDILDQSKSNNRRQEKKARAYAFEMLVPLNRFAEAFADGARNKYELAEFFEVTEDFFEDALHYYIEKYGFAYRINEKYTLYLQPLGILKNLCPRRN